MNVKTIVFAGSALLAMTSITYSKDLITGIPSCIMEHNGVVGSHSDGKQTIYVREPPVGDYEDFNSVNKIFIKDTGWTNNYSYDYRNGSTNNNGHKGEHGYWGEIDDNFKITILGGILSGNYGMPGTTSNWRPSEIRKPFNMVVSTNATFMLGSDGYTYHRGAYKRYVWQNAREVNSNYNGYFQWDVYGIYRDKTTVDNVPAGTKFGECGSTAPENDWVLNNYVKSDEMNNAFTEFESKITKEINDKKMNLILISEMVDVTESASAGLELSYSGKSFGGDIVSFGQSGRSASSSVDATSLGKAFEKK